MMKKKSTMIKKKMRKTKMKMKTNMKITLMTKKKKFQMNF